jgi:hypothetical protein
MYRITYGYNHRYAGSYKDTEEFETKEQLKEWLIEFEYHKLNPRPNTDDDIMEIIEIINIGEYLTGTFNLEKEVKMFSEERKKHKEIETIRRRKIAEQIKLTKQKKKEENDKKKLKELAEKYPEILK